MIPITRPRLAAPGREDHKYSRGMVAVIEGAMPGAAMLAAQAAMRGGAGYVVLAGRDPQPGPPHALVRRRIGRLEEVLEDARIGALVLGPGLGEGGGDWLEAALTGARPLVLDGDALTLLARTGAERAGHGERAAILTPHAGEFDRLFGASVDDRPARTLAAARRAGVVVVHKGADTVVAAPDGRIATLDDGPGWLASAGTGDVLAGLVGARLAAGDVPFDAACAAVWLHARAARMAGPALIADDLPPLIAGAIAECL